ncbi:MAG: DUF3137 domain-containing protein [Candidatus Altiarchaeota archaeon]
MINEIFIALPILILFVIIYHILDRNRAVKENWQKLSQMLGLKFSQEGFLSFVSNKLEGTYRDHYLNLYTYLKQYGRHSRRFTKLIVKIKNQKGVSLKIYPENFISKIEKTFGMQDISLGNENFDKEFIVKGNNEKFVREILSCSIQMKILNTKNFNLGVNGEKAEFEEQKVIIDINRLRAIIDLTIDIAEKIESIN